MGGRIRADRDTQTEMNLQHLTDLSDPRLDPYRHLRTSNLTRFSGRFIAESKPLVLRLIASGLEIESILVDIKYLDDAKTWLPDGVIVLVMPSEAVSELIGFHFHRGFLACGLRPVTIGWGDQAQRALEIDSDWTGAFLVGVQDPENMGSILRSCAALGIEDILLGPQCVDPYARRVLRVSMGNAFKLRMHAVADPIRCLEQLRTCGVESIAACLSPDSIELSAWERTGPTLMMLGNEAYGLPDAIVAAATQRLRIDMELGTDSLNVSVAAGIILHYACRLAGNATRARIR